MKHHPLFRLFPIIGIIPALALVVFYLLSQPTARAASPGLQLNPLKYEDTLTAGHVKSGYIDVGNPGDTPLAVEAGVQGFRQANLAGDLEFFLDDPITKAITLGLTSFNLGPRESIRVSFTVDPDKLPKGGVYAAVFFRTIPPPGQSSTTSYVAESANVGTLLLLQNGAESEHIGRITSFHLPFLQFGGGLSGGRAQYQNTNRTTAPLAFAPQLTTRILPWGKPAKLTGPYVLPGSTRQLDLARPGSYFGLLPVTLTDTASGQHLTRWILACTGYYGYIMLLSAILIMIFFVRRAVSSPAKLSWPRPFAPPPPTIKAIRRFLARHFRRRKPAPVKRSLDGLARPKDK